MEVDGEEQGAAVKEAALKADSVVVLLSQALQAQDRALLERCHLLANPTLTHLMCKLYWPVIQHASVAWIGPEELLLV